ncbi:MAG: endonuclease/exonuclease/phosphatase family protein [Planctomycetes bacterium]|nr:endonuclease/exonuclease/phosphatase family protein [Planctomycetota bacterium]
MLCARRLLLVSSLAAAAFAAGCNAEDFLSGLSGLSGSKAADTASRPTPAGLADVGKGDDTIAVGSFNIQVFGTSKLGKPDVMEVLVNVARRFDVLAIQEIRSVDQTVVPQFVRAINADGSQFDFLLGERLGRTSSKEQYAFVYDTSRIEVVPRSVYTAYDPEDRLHREPLVATFRVRGSSSPQPFSFTLINIHTDPDETDTELDALDDVFVGVQREPGGEDDVILLGDLNVDETHFGQLGRLPDIGWAISGMPTNTRRTKTYDNVVFNRRSTVEFTGRSGVLDLTAEYGLGEEAALAVSDHLPVYAVFSAREGRSVPLASRPIQRQ